MPIEFPIPTFIGQEFFAGGKGWSWNGFAWDSIANTAAIGATGATGPTGQSSTFYNYKADTTTLSGVPAVGTLFWDNATQLSATTVTLSHIEALGNDIDVFFQLFKVNDIFIVQDQGNSNNFQTWKINAAPTVVLNSYITMPVTLVTSGGTSQFVNNQQLIFAIVTSGLTGATGATGVGATGATGSTGIGATGATGASYLAYVFEAMDHFNGSTSTLQLTAAAIAGGSANYVNPTTYNGFGIFRLETQNSTTANTGARINQTGNTISFAPKGIGEFRHISRAMRISADMFDATIQGTFRTGIGDVINAQPNNGIYFQCLNTNYVQFVTRSAGAETTTSTGFSILQDAWNSFEFILATDGLSVVAKINGNTVATHTTNIPNAYMGVITFLQKQAAVAGYVRFDLDFIYQKFTPSPIPFNP